MLLVTSVDTFVAVGVKFVVTKFVVTEYEGWQKPRNRPDSEDKKSAPCLANLSRDTCRNRFLARSCVAQTALMA